MKIKQKVTELVNTDVQFVSLVDRGANKSPFKILKVAEVADQVAPLLPA